MVDPTEAAIDALAVWLEGQPGITKAIRGWPEQPKDLDVSAGPVVSIIPGGEPTYSWGTPAVVATAPRDDGKLLVTWRLADLVQRLQVDVWASHRAVRNRVAAQLAAAWHDDLPFRTGLELAASKHFGVTASLIPLGSVPMDDAATAPVGEWRQRIELELRMSVCAQGTTPAQAKHTLQLTTEIQGADVVEPDPNY